MGGVEAGDVDHHYESSGSTLPVPSVQELAAQGLEVVPERYIKDEIGHGNDHLSGSCSPSIVVPLIDISKLLNNDDSELQKLHSACKDWGAFQLINHGVPIESVKKMRKRTQEFFELPLQEKKRLAQQPGSQEGYGQVFVISEDQKLDWNDMLIFRILPTQRRHATLWPQIFPSFRETLVDCSENMKKLAVQLMKFMAKALEVDDEELSQNYEDGNYDIRLTCYPPCPEPERVLGILPHEDASAITLLLEGGDTPGLQVLKDGQWVVVEPIDGAIIVNLGQIMEVITNGIYKAVLHRVVVNRLKERLSIGVFCYPRPSAMIGPSKQLIKPGSSPLYKTMTNAEFFHLFFTRNLEDSFINILKLDA
ncbi:hypothetical protein PTKIN_Ptkin09bG0260700 [Pterospermum kingtungense]